MQDNMGDHKLESVTVTYKIGRSFFPSPYYEQTISTLKLSEDMQVLIITTSENRVFEIRLSDLIEKNKI
jgi:hypothetical protein